MIIIQDVFVIRHEVPDKSYVENNGDQMTSDAAVAYEYDLEIDGAIEAIDAAKESNVHWSRKVTYVDG